MYSYSEFPGKQNWKTTDYRYYDDEYEAKRHQEELDRAGSSSSGSYATSGSSANDGLDHLNFSDAYGAEPAYREALQYESQGKLNEALAAFTVAVEKSDQMLAQKEHAYCLIRRGMVYFKLQQYSDASYDLELATRYRWGGFNSSAPMPFSELQQKTQAVTYNYLGCAYDARGESWKESAIEAWKKAVALGSNDAKQNLDNLQNRQQAPAAPAPQSSGAAKFCMKCGNQLPEGAKFCNKCGAPTQAAAAPQPAPAPQQAAPQPAAPTPAPVPVPTPQPAPEPQAAPQAAASQPGDKRNAPIPTDIFVKSHCLGNKVVNNVSFVVGNKEIVALTSTSEEKLSSIIRMIAGFEKIIEGEIFIDDTLINDLSYHDRNVAMVSGKISTDIGTPSLFNSKATDLLYQGGMAFKMNTFDIMAYELKYRKVPKDEIERRIREATKLFKIDELMDRKVIALSGGQRLRMSVSRAIVRNPKVYLFDNPFSNFTGTFEGKDYRTKIREEICSVLRSFNATAIFTTTDQAEAEEIADRVVVL